MKTHLRQKLGDGVACASVAPMPLHCLICHAGINTRLIIAPQRENGGSLITLLAFGQIWMQLADSQDTLFWGLFLEAREDIPKINF